MASLVLSGDTSGSITVSAPAVAGSNTQTLPAVSGTILVQGTASNIVSGTAVTASSTSVDFTDIPSLVKRITVMFSGVSTSGTSSLQVQLGDSGGIETTSYVACGSYGQQSQNWNLVAFTSGFPIAAANANLKAASVLQGSMTITNITGNNWVVNSMFYDSTAIIQTHLATGQKTLSDVLTQVRITTVNGTDTFDAGSINILYE
jgi:hypothetical protein